MALSIYFFFPISDTQLEGPKTDILLDFLKEMLTLLHP